MFLKHQAKKDANSIVSYIHDFLKFNKTFDDASRVRRLVFSDNADKQKKNVTVIRYCVWLLAMYYLIIEHRFPTRCHSFSV